MKFSIKNKGKAVEAELELGHDGVLDLVLNGYYVFGINSDGEGVLYDGVDAGEVPGIKLDSVGRIKVIKL